MWPNANPIKTNAGQKENTRNRLSNSNCIKLNNLSTSLNNNQLINLNRYRTIN